MSHNSVAKRFQKLNTEKKIDIAINKLRKKYDESFPYDLFKNYEVDELTEEGCKEYRIVPKENFNGTYLFYIYGGAMCLNISSEQWQFILELAKKTNSGIFVPIYPVAPENSCRDTFRMLETAYMNSARSRDVEKIVLIGDSTGAGLALSITMLAWEEGYRKPDQLILISPVLDTEFFDTNLEKQVLSSLKKEDRFYYTLELKNYINSNWVKEYATRFEYTSPFYCEDYTDICGDIAVFSGTDDMFNCYARRFYRKAKSQGVNIRFFEFGNANHDFMIFKKTKESVNAFGYLVDVIAGTYVNSYHQLYPLKKIAQWSKKYPDRIKDTWAEKFIYDNKIDKIKLGVNKGQYRNYLIAADCVACDEMVKKYIMEYPNCTIVRVGCDLDNMFARLDNGRIRWYSVGTHNTMSVRRSIYGDFPREKTVGRSIMDLSWLDEIKCNQNQGVMFVCNNKMRKLKLSEIKILIEATAEKFPGAEFVFTSSTTSSKILSNIVNRKYAMYEGKDKSSINDAQAIFNGWRADFKVKNEEPLAKYFPIKKKFKLFTKIAIKYNLLSYNHKIIRLKLGNEKYETQ